MATVNVNKTIEVCDFCGHDGYLKSCLVCDSRYCLVCEGMVAGCMVLPNICRECATRDDVFVICDTHGKAIKEITNTRDNALRELTAQLRPR